MMSLRTLLESKRIYRSQLLVPGLQRGHLVLSHVLPSALIRLRFSVKQRQLPAPRDQDDRVTKMSLWLEWYQLVTTVLLYVFVWSQSHPWAWQPSRWAWILEIFVGLVVVVRIGEILSQSVEVVLNRIDVDAASGLSTLLIYVFQTVAIFAICSEYASYASGYHEAFKSDVGSFPNSWLDYLYLAWANLVTFGAAYPPETSWSRLVVVSSSTIFILLVSVLLAFVVAQIRPTECQLSHPDADSQSTNIPDSAG
jgi:hypothetical protein